MVEKLFDKKSKGGIKSMSNQQLANELHKTVVIKSNRQKIYSSFKDNTWGADLTDMQLISKYNKEIRILLYVIDLFSKYACFVPLKDKKRVNIVNAFESTFQIIQNKIKQNVVYQGSESYNNSFKKSLEDNDIHCVKSVRIWSYSGPYFSAFGLNTGRRPLLKDMLLIGQKNRFYNQHN